MKLPVKNIHTKKSTLMGEIAASKRTYCWFASTEYGFYDKIIYSVGDIVDEGVVYRLMTDEHIPQNRGKKHGKRPLEWVNFPPFKHFILDRGAIIEVGRSHWKGSLSNGEFSVTEGQITNELAKTIVRMVSSYIKKPNWRGYSYASEMEGDAIVALCRNGLKFDEARSDNPFAYFTQIMKHAFVKYLRNEKQHQNLRDDIMVSEGVAATSARYSSEFGVHEDVIQKKRKPDSRTNKGLGGLEP